MVVVIIAVEVSSVELEIMSSMQRLSPEMQSSQDSSIVGQVWNRIHSEADIKNVNHRHPLVKSHTWRQSSAVAACSAWRAIPAQLPSTQHAAWSGMQSVGADKQSWQYCVSKIEQLLKSWQKLVVGLNVSQLHLLSKNWTQIKVKNRPDLYWAWQRLCPLKLSFFCVNFDHSERNVLRQLDV